MQPISLQGRLARIVEIVFAGSANAAAVAAKVEPSTLHRLLEGKVADPRINTVRKLAEAFGVPTAWLLGIESTESAQGRETSFPESYWLLWAYHRKRQLGDRERLRANPSPAAMQVREAVADLDLSPESAGFPMKSISHLLRDVSPDDPDRLQIERGFAELEGRLVAMAARQSASASPHRKERHGSADAPTTDED